MWSISWEKLLECLSTHLKVVQVAAEWICPPASHETGFEGILSGSFDIANFPQGFPNGPTHPFDLYAIVVLTEYHKFLNFSERIIWLEVPAMQITE